MTLGTTFNAEMMRMMTTAAEWTSGRTTFKHPRLGVVTIERIGTEDTNPWVMVSQPVSPAKE